MEARHRVLLVEDDEMLRRLLAVWLRTEGYSVAAAEGAEAALVAAEEAAPDVVLTDVEMPGANGVQLTHQLKERYSLPVFLMSAGSEPPIHEADGFFPKPLNFQAVSEALRDSWALFPRRRAVGL